MIMMPLNPMFLRLFNINSQQFGYIVSVYSLSAGASGLMAAFFVDRFDRKKILIFFYVGFIGGTFLCSLSETYMQFLFARAITGAFGGVLMSIVLAILSDIVPLERRATAMGILTTGFSMASVFGVPFGLYLAQIHSWQLPFVSLAGFASLLLIALLWILPPINAHLTTAKTKAFEVLFSLFKDRNQLTALAFTLALVFGQFLVIPFISASFVFNAGLPEAQLPLIYLTGGICSIFAGPIVGKIADRFGKRQTFFFGALFSTVPVLMITHLGLVSVVSILLISSSFFIFMSGRMVPAMAIISAATTSAKRGSFMSFVSSAQQFSMSLAAAIAGSIIIEDTAGHLLRYNWVGYISVAFTFLAIHLSRKTQSVEGKL